MTRNGNSVDFSAIAYWRYVVGILVALFAIPALLQGAMAFFRAFFATLTTMLLAVNVVAFGAIAAGVGLFFWQRERQLASAEDSHATVEANSTNAPGLQQPYQAAIDPHLEQQQPPNLPASHQSTTGDRQPGQQPTPVTVNQDVQNVKAVKAVKAKVEQPQTNTMSASAAAEPRQSLIQAQLARRLQVSSSTIGKRKHKPDFSQWAQTKDPEGLLWQYCSDSKEFFASHRPT
jgi:cytoskeletal protein RodZ